MRVVFTTVEQLCDEIEHEAESIVDGTIRVRIDIVHEQEDNPNKEVQFWATALTKNGTILYELGLHAGRDTPNNESKGSTQAANWKEQIQATLDACNLRMRPGKIELY